MNNLSKSIESFEAGMAENFEGYRKAKEFTDKLTQEEREALLAKREAEIMQRGLEQLRNQEKQAYKRLSVWGGSGEQHFSFERWNPENQQNSQQALELKDKARGLAKRAIKGPGLNILLAGTAGTGKTALVLAMKEAIEKYSDKTVMFVSTVSVADKVHDFHNDQAQQRLRYVKEYMKKADILILDDFGSEAGGMGGTNKSASEPLQKFFFEVAEARQAKDNEGNRLKTTIVTTNNRIGTGPGELMALYHEKIISRLIAKKSDNQLIFTNMEDLRE